MKSDARDNYNTRHGGPFDRGAADSWYDNEWGYSSRVEELIGRLAKMDDIS